MNGEFTNNTGSRIVGECRQCGACCYFTYWLSVEQSTDFDYYLEYARRFFDSLELRRTSDTVGIMVVHDLPCRYLDKSNNRCIIHGTPAKSEDCCKYPFHWPTDLFGKVRDKSCGYTVEQDPQKKV